MSEVHSSPGWFDYGRLPPFPAIYPSMKSPVTVDVLEIGWVVAFFTLLISFYFILPAANNAITRFVRVTFFMLLGLSIMLCNFGQEWEVGKLHTHTHYRAGTADTIVADIGVKLGLRSVNITLKGAAENEQSPLAGETINYNERFTWAWAQGRAGFGPFAGQIQREYRAAQFKGLPYPILWIAEYFTFDGEGIRFGRHYRTSGWYAHICIWAAFPMWIITVVMFKMVIKYAAMALALTGLLLIIPAIIWAANRNFIELLIPFEDGNLVTHFGVHWYLSLIVGIICLVAGTIIFFLDDKYNNELSQFFGNNPFAIVEEGFQVEQPETTPTNEVEMERMDATPEGPRLVATFRGRGTSARKWKERAVVLPPVSSRNELLATHFEIPQGSSPRMGGSGGRRDHNKPLPPPVSSHQYPGAPSTRNMGASNVAYEPEFRHRLPVHERLQQSQQNHQVQSEIYDDLNAGEEEPIYANLNKQ